MQSRRQFLKQAMICAGGVLVLGQKVLGGKVLDARPLAQQRIENPVTTVYRAVNGRPDENLLKVNEMMGGIEKIVGSNDVVVIKPNVQWWNQGAPNLLALKTFVEVIMDRPGGFDGEVVMAENCHRGQEPWTSTGSGWENRFVRNSLLEGIANMNELGAHLKKKYGNRFSVCHWVDVAAGAKRVFGPQDGPGYVYCDGNGGVPAISLNNGCAGSDHRSVIMTYPIFRTGRGTIVDFKNGVWERGSYTGRPLRFINFPALNHHSTYCGATSAVKNYLGVTDLSGGPDPHNGGRLTGTYYNFHSFPLNKWAPGPAAGMLGAEIGVFMNTIRRADLTITTAEWVGFASRTEPPVAHTRAVLACTDPVALDFHATKYLLYPNSKVAIHNPEDKDSPLREYLMKCSEEGGGIFDERYVAVKSYDFKTKAFQDDSDLVVMGEKEWGTNIKTILKYMLLRYWI